MDTALDATTTTGTDVAHVVIDPQRQTEITANAQKWLAATLGEGIGSPAFKEAINDLTTVGQPAIAAAAEVSHRLLERPSARGGDDSPAAKVGNDLVGLRVAITELDPKRNDLTGVAKLFKFLPGQVRRRAEAFVHRVESAKTQLDAISTSLTAGQDNLLQDNLALELERRTMWKAMGTLAEAKVYVESLSEATHDRIDSLRSEGDEHAATALESDVLFALNQRHMDLMTQVAVNAQGYLALDVVHRNNTELVKGVERAKTTTMTALRTGMITAQALTQQGIVLKQVTSLNEATSALIVENSERLKGQAAAINEQASTATIDAHALETALSNVLQALDAIDVHRATANPAMESTIGALAATLDAGIGGHLQRSHSGTTTLTAEVTHA